MAKKSIYKAPKTTTKQNKNGSWTLKCEGKKIAGVSSIKPRKTK